MHPEPASFRWHLALGSSMELGAFRDYWESTDDGLDPCGSLRWPAEACAALKPLYLGLRQQGANGVSLPPRRAQDSPNQKLPSRFRMSLACCEAERLASPAAVWKRTWCLSYAGPPPPAHGQQPASIADTRPLLHSRVFPFPRSMSLVLAAVHVTSCASCLCSEGGVKQRSP